MPNSYSNSKKVKYHNKKTIIDGIKFDSKLEAKRYQELKEMEEKGLIRALVLQPKFQLIPKFQANGKTYRKCTYIADFSYYDVKTGKTFVEDAKGYANIFFDDQKVHTDRAQMAVPSARVPYVTK